MPRASRTAETADAASLLSIGELAERTRVPATALRYYDECGLVRPAARSSGQRRYAASAVTEVAAVLLLREVGFSIAEIASLVAGGERESWRDAVERKLAEVVEQRHRLEVAQTALEHALRCPAAEPMQCTRFLAIIDGFQRGLSLEESHARADLP